MKGSIFLMALVFMFFSSCTVLKLEENFLKEQSVPLSTHSLMTYRSKTDKDVTVIFESGMGDGAGAWIKKDLVKQVVPLANVIIYDRGGYGKSGQGPTARNVAQLSQELDAIVKTLPSNQKVVLVGHSFGGMIIRDWAVKHPAQLKGLLFVDPSHENYTNPTQEQEDKMYSLSKTLYGQNSGVAREARELRESAAYVATLGNLPDVPTIVITSMKVAPDKTQEDRQLWYNAHQQLGKGISNFKHIVTEKSGHSIHEDEPELVVEQLKALIR